MTQGGGNSFFFANMIFVAKVLFVSRTAYEYDCFLSRSIFAWLRKDESRLVAPARIVFPHSSCNSVLITDPISNGISFSSSSLHDERDHIDGPKLQSAGAKVSETQFLKT